MNVLVIGTEGQLARSIRERAGSHSDLQFIFVGRPQADMSKVGSIAMAVAGSQADVVINAAAYTAVDQAEVEPDLALRINGKAAGEAAAAAAKIGARFIQISTDYVFDGRSEAPYREDDRTAPINVYGRSKLAGEELVRSANPNHLIVRTCWLYSAFGSNFVKTMLRLARERDEVRVVADQIGCPTSAHDLAEALLTTVSRSHGWGGTYHLASPEPCSWAELATAVFDASQRGGGPHARVIPIGTDDYPTPARRPCYSVLDSSRFAQTFGPRLPTFLESVPQVVERVLSKNVPERDSA